LTFGAIAIAPYKFKINTQQKEACNWREPFGFSFFVSSFSLYQHKEKKEKAK